MYVYIWININIYFLLGHLRGTERNNTPIAKSTPKIQTLVSNTILQ